MLCRKLVIVATLGILAAPLVLAEEQPSEGKHCLPIQSISTTRVIDRQHILFKMRSGPDYMNELPNKCPGPYKSKAIMYKTSLSKVCDLDIVTVLDSIGGGYMPGASCGLGHFVPVEPPQNVEPTQE